MSRTPLPHAAAHNHRPGLLETDVNYATNDLRSTRETAHLRSRRRPSSWDAAVAAAIIPRCNSLLRLSAVLRRVQPDNRITLRTYNNSRPHRVKLFIFFCT